MSSYICRCTNEYNISKMTSTTIKTIVIDDNVDWLEIIAAGVNAHPKLELIGTFNSPVSAHSLITEGKVDLIFLDIEMPEVNGFEFAKYLINPPLIVFVTSHRNFAVESYEINAVDYLMKPYSIPRFMQAVEKASLKLNEKRGATSLKYDSFFFIRENNQYVKIETDNILYLSSLQNYTQIVTSEQTHTTLMTLTELEEHIPPSVFLRVHRSFIVNTLKINSVNRTEIIINDHVIPIARNLATDIINSLVKSHLVTKGT